MSTQQLAVCRAFSLEQLSQKVEAIRLLVILFEHGVILYRLLVILFEHGVMLYQP
jgi:hypothetical protein